MKYINYFVEGIPTLLTITFVLLFGYIIVKDPLFYVPFY